MKDGSPQITPVWIDWERNTNTILINTTKGRLKQESISRDPCVAISIADHNNPYEMVTIRGKVIEQNTEGTVEHADKLAKKYMGLDRYLDHSPNEQRTILKVKPKKIYLQQPPK
jgi:PPOX class probable F420-dependent enzyme